MKTQKGKDGQNKSDNSSTGSTELSVISDSIDKNGNSADPEAFGNDIEFKRTKNRMTKRQRSKSIQGDQDIVLTRELQKHI